MLFWALAVLPLGFAGGLALGSPVPMQVQLSDAVNPPQRCIQGRTGFGRAVALPDAVYCANLARGYGALRVNPRQALQLAEAAFAQHPEVAPRLLLARAQVALEQWDAAWGNFEVLLSTLHTGALSTPALHDLGVAAALTGHDQAALDVYRSLLPRLDSLSAERRARAPFEAALAALRVSPTLAAEARAAVHLALLNRTGRVAHGLGPALLDVADELQALRDETAAPPRPRALEVWPGEPAPRVNQPVIPKLEAALLELVLKGSPKLQGKPIGWQDLAEHPNPTWRSLALSRLRDSRP
jgi:hypothetical protein